MGLLLCAPNLTNGPQRQPGPSNMTKIKVCDLFGPDFSPNSVCLRGSNDVSVPGANLSRFSGLVPVSVFVVTGTRFMRTRDTW